MQHQDTIKAAAKRMCEVLGADGVKVKHTRMLEALAAGLGLDSWRALKAVIDAPRAVCATALPAKPTLPPPGEEQTWTVHAVYVDNAQQYGDYYGGRTPLEAAYQAILERLTDCGLEIQIEEVLNANDECKLSPNFLTEISVVPNDSALRVLLRSVMAIAASPTWSGELGLARDFLFSAVDGLLEDPKPNRGVPRQDSLDFLTDWSQLDEVGTTGAQPIWEGTTLVPTKALLMLCEAVETHFGGVVQFELRYEELAKCVYQVRAMCEHFAAVVDSATHGLADVERIPFQIGLAA